jgi:hypothetical protein
MKFTVSGPDPEALMRAIASLPAFSATPTAVDVDRVDHPGTADWLTQWMPQTEKHLRVEWGEDTVLWRSRSCVLAKSPTFGDDLPGLARVIAELSFELAALWTPHGLDWNAAGYRPTGFADGHVPHGWACMFKGAGHERLVSRRWLDDGPWRFTSLPGDVSLVEFYDLAADSATALAQAKVGHERMGISRSGGFFQIPYPYYNKLDGVYDSAKRTYKIPVAVRKLKASEMLDASALRVEKRNDPKTPIELCGFTFVMGKEEAGPYLHELWTRELGCWAVVDGVDVRLDDSYTPPPHKPPW